MKYKIKTCCINSEGHLVPNAKLIMLISFLDTNMQTRIKNNINTIINIIYNKKELKTKYKYKCIIIK
jgi:galactitol-specific phosphotransferase system IIB component